MILCSRGVRCNSIMYIHRFWYQNQKMFLCIFQNNVNGEQCEVCKDGNFDLQESNEAGCTKCFCFGKTTRCGSANLYWSQVTLYAIITLYPLINILHIEK